MLFRVIEKEKRIYRSKLTQESLADAQVSARLQARTKSHSKEIYS